MYHQGHCIPMKKYCRLCMFNFLEIENVNFYFILSKTLCYINYCKTLCSVKENLKYRIYIFFCLDIY